MKKFIILLLLVQLALFSACDTYATIEYYPWNKCETWYCKEIDMDFSFKLDDNGTLLEGPKSQLIVNGKILNVEVGFQGDAILFFSEPDASNISEVLVDGTWNYKNGNIVVTILKDTLFDGQYSELVFVPQ